MLSSRCFIVVTSVIVSKHHRRSTAMLWHSMASHVPVSGNVDALVALQTMKAIQYWNKSNFGEALKKQVNDDVLRNLKEGKVLPIFHILCRPPEKRLFPQIWPVSVEDKNLDMIQLSATHVTMGKSNSEKESVGEISSRREASYVPAFFKEDFGYFEVKDCNFSWKYDDDYTKIITDLVNAPAVMAGEDVEVTELLEPLIIDDKSGRNLITRRLSRGVVADCLEKSKRGSTYAITGDRGIGKSWTLIYALQQALLYENACVLLCFQKEGMAIVCIRRNDKMYVWSCKHSSFRDNLDSNLFQNSNVLALLDPCESKKEGAAFSEGRRMLIMAASNNAKHFYSSIKSTPDMLRLLSAPTMTELVVCVPYMIDGPLVPDDVSKMLQRVYIVGLLPRYILSDQSFKKRCTETEEATKNLLKVRAMLSDTGLITNESSLPGCVFSVNVKLFSNINLDDGAPSFDRTVTDDVAVASVGYDGERIMDYGNLNISIMSRFVQSSIGFGCDVSQELIPYDVLRVLR